MRTPGVMAVVIALCACGQPIGAADHEGSSAPPRNAGAHCDSDEECDDPRLYCIDAYITKRICVSKSGLGGDCNPSHPERCLSGFCNEHTQKCSMPLAPGACDVAADCGGSNACRTRTCVQGRCGEVDAPASTLLEQSLGDCSEFACDGAGNLVVIEDDLDAPENTFCRPAGCSGGVRWEQRTPLGTPCGPGNEVCIFGECRVPSLQIAFDPPSTAPGEVRVLSGGTEIARCTASCSVEVTVGQDYVVEAASAGSIYLDGPQCPNNGSRTSCAVTGAYASTVRVAFFGDPPIVWTHLGEPGEIERVAGFDRTNNLYVGSNRHLTRFTPDGRVAWMIDLPVSSIAIDLQITPERIYVLSNDQLLRVDATGAVLWQQQADTCPDENNFPGCLATSRNGDVVFGGPRAMRWSPDGTLRWSTAHDPLWTHNSVLVDVDDVTHVLRSDTGEDGMVASRLAADGSVLAPLIDSEHPSLATPDVRLANGDNRATVAYLVNHVLAVREYRNDGFAVGGTAFDLGAHVPFGLAIHGSWPHLVFQNDPVLGGFDLQVLDGFWLFQGGTIRTAEAGLEHPIGLVPHGIADGTNVAIVGTYQGLDGSMGWVQVLDRQAMIQRY